MHLLIWMKNPCLQNILWKN